MRIFFHILLVSANFIVSIALIVACVAGYVSPKYVWPIAFLGLSFPILFILNVLLGIYWLIRWKKEILISAAALFCGMWQVPKYVASNDNAVSMRERGDTLRVMTYNVHLFSQYDKDGGNENSMLDFIKAQDADIICFQEFFVYDDNLTEEDIRVSLREYRHVYIDYTRDEGPRRFGNAIFSKYPLVKRGKVAFKDATTNSSIYADAKVGKDTIRVFCNHLESVRLREIDKPNNWKEQIANKEFGPRRVKTIVRKLRRAYITRASQVDSIKRELESNPHPAILCGDFNDLPSSYTYNEIIGEMNDAFVDAGNGITETYNGLLPTMRIDFVFSDDIWRAYRYQSPKVKYSDHYPIIVDLARTKPQHSFLARKGLKGN